MPLDTALVTKISLVWDCLLFFKKETGEAAKVEFKSNSAPKNIPMLAMAIKKLNINVFNFVFIFPPP